VISEIRELRETDRQTDTLVAILLFLSRSGEHTYIHTNLHSAKNRENESDALAQDD